MRKHLDHIENKEEVMFAVESESDFGFLNTHTEEMVGYLKPRESEVILDIGAGTGDHSMNLARKLSTGRVIIADLSKQKLSAIEERAKSHQVYNLDTCGLISSTLPFADQTFDAVTSRLGLMYFSNIELLVTEMVRVLKPSGRLSITLWNTSDHNLWMSHLHASLIRHQGITEPSLSTSKLFCSVDQVPMARYLRVAGLKGVVERIVKWNALTAEMQEYWPYLYASMTPVAVDTLIGQSELSKVNEEIINDLNSMYSESAVLETSAVHFYGQK
ncbi:MAG: methyltransferase domain-containing protein [Reichenbachiella sp.]|uniref:class I SAM-dependent methyltransferase n=1 Tax=Reichenbachiella sp. TaxID=2184521 RepID=UPI0032636D2F